MTDHYKFTDASAQELRDLIGWVDAQEELRGHAVTDITGWVEGNARPEVYDMEMLIEHLDETRHKDL